eukprot:2657253-Rhodomonas_salina.1
MHPSPSIFIMVRGNSRYSDMIFLIVFGPWTDSLLSWFQGFGGSNARRVLVAWGTYPLSGFYPQ